MLNAANEVAVDLFLTREIDFAQIPQVIEAGLQGYRSGGEGSLEEVLAADQEVREQLSRRYRGRVGQLT